MPLTAFFSLHPTLHDICADARLHATRDEHLRRAGGGEAPVRGRLRETEAGDDGAASRLGRQHNSARPGFGWDDGANRRREPRGERVRSRRRGEATSVGVVVWAFSHDATARRGQRDVGDAAGVVVEKTFDDGEETQPENTSDQGRVR